MGWEGEGGYADIIGDEDMAVTPGGVPDDKIQVFHLPIDMNELFRNKAASWDRAVQRSN